MDTSDAKETPLTKPAEPDAPSGASRTSCWLHAVSSGLALYNIAAVQHWIDWNDPVTVFSDAITMSPSAASAALNALIGAALTASAVFSAKRFFDEDTVGATHEKQAMQLAGLAGTTATMWLIDAAGNPSRPMSVVLLIFWATVFGVLYVILRSKEPERIRQRRAEDAEKKQRSEEYKLTREEKLQLRTYRELWDPWLQECGIPGRVIAFKTTAAGYTLTIGPYTEDGKRYYPSYSAVSQKFDALTARASEHYEQSEGNRLDDQAFRLERTDAAHKVLLHVSTKKILEESRPHPGVEPPRSITQPIVTGVYEDGAPLAFNAVGNNMIIVGATGSGKSTYAHNYIAAWLASYDGEIWVAAMRKLMPLVGPWLDPWLKGLSPRPAIQRIGGESADEVLKLLADFYEAANEYNKRLLDDKRSITPDEPAMCLIIEESSSVTNYTDKTVTTYDGRQWTAEALLNEICQICRSAGLNVFFLTQYGLVDALGGKFGTKILRNVNCRIAARTNSVSDGRSILNAASNVDTTRLRNNTLRVQTSKDVPRVLPAKAFDLRTGEQVESLAIAYAERRHHPPAWLVRRFGESYIDRWNPERQPALVERCKLLGVPYPTLTPEVTGEYLLKGAPDTRTDWRSPAVEAAGEETTPLIEIGSRVTSGLKDAMERLAVHREIRIRGDVINALCADDAPDWVPASDLAIAAQLVDRNASDNERAAAAQRLINLFSVAPYSADLETRDDQQGWSRDLLLSRIREVMDKERGAQDAQGEQAGSSAEGRRLLDALSGVSDEWILVGELGRRTGDITAEDGEEYRKQAAMFGQKLREAPLEIPGDLFKSSNKGKMVSVAGLRDVLTGQGVAA